MENAKYQEKREKDERMKHVVGGEREKKADSREREETILSSFSHYSWYLAALFSNSEDQPNHFI